MAIQRTSLITAASIAGVLLAGGSALGANIGILNASSSSPIGTLPAGASTPDATTRAGWKVVLVGDAGAVTLSTEGAAIDIRSIEPAEGWRRSVDRVSPGQVTVSFTKGSRNLVMTAVLGADGAITATVEELVSEMPVAPAGTVASLGESPDRSGDDHETDDDDDRSAATSTTVQPRTTTTTAPRHSDDEREGRDDERDGRDDDD